MAITYTNRKGRLYHLCQGVTKKGTTRYYFSREPKGATVEVLPEGYEIRESINSIVSLAKIQKSEILECEFSAVQVALQAHPQGNRFQMQTKGKQITIYENSSPPPVEMLNAFPDIMEFHKLNGNGLIHAAEELSNKTAQFSPVMRFTLLEGENPQRYFYAERMCYRSSIDGWLDICSTDSISNLTSDLIPKLATDDFFDLI